MLYDAISADSANSQLAAINLESQWADASLTFLSTGKEADVRKQLPLIRSRTALAGKRSCVLNDNAFNVDFNRSVTLSMEGAGDLVVSVYLSAKKLLVRILEAIKAFIKKVRDFIFRNKAKKAAQEKVAVAAIKSSDEEVRLVIPQSKVSDFCWFLQDEDFKQKDTYRLDEITSVLIEKLQWLEDVVFDFLGNAEGINTLLDVVKQFYTKRDYESAKKFSLEGYREKYFRKIKHFGENPGVLYVEVKKAGTEDEFDVLKRKPLQESVGEMVITIRPGASQDIKNLFAVDNYITALISKIELAHVKINAVVGSKELNAMVTDGKVTEKFQEGKSKIERQFNELHAKKNTAKKKSMGVLEFVKGVYNGQVMGMVESLNNITFVVNKMISALNSMTEQASKDSTNKPSMEDDSVGDNSAAIAGAFDLYTKLIENKQQTDESFAAISENLRALGEIANKIDWSNPLTIGGKHYLEPTVPASIDVILRTSNQLKTMASQLGSFNQGATGVTRTQFAEIKQNVAGLRLFGVFWGSDGERHEAQPTQATLSVDKEGAEMLIEEMTGLLLSLVDCHEQRFAAVSAVHQMASQAITARNKNEYYRKEDLDLMLAGFDFFDSAFCVNLVAGRLNDTVTAIHSSITLKS